MSEERAAGERMLDKLRRFVSSQLDVDERRLFGALVAPGLLAALTAGDEVRGFDLAPTHPARLPDGLIQAVASSGLDVTGWTPAADRTAT